MEEKCIVSAWYNMVRKQHFKTYCEVPLVCHIYYAAFTIEVVLPDKSESNSNTHKLTFVQHLQNLNADLRTEKQI